MLATGNSRPPAEPARTVVSALIARRKALGLRQADVGELMHVGQSAVCQFERTQNPRIDTLLRYADAVGVSLMVELRDDPVPEPS
jgi:transcriptional regulator with XRE-family HTH domain